MNTYSLTRNDSSKTALRPGPVPTLIVLILLGLLFLAPLSAGRSSEYDEGLVVYGALRVMDGDVPVRDFWAYYPPGQFYLLAYLFRLFGATLNVERILDLAVRTGIAVSVYWLCASLASPLVGALAWAVAVLWLGAVGFHAYPMFSALLLVLVGFCCLFRGLTSQSTLAYLVAGLLHGAATIFKIEIGCLGMASAAAAMMAAQVRRRLSRPGGSGAWDVAYLRYVFLLSAGFFVPVTAVLLWMASMIPMESLWENFISLPHRVFSEYRKIPAPSLIPDLSFDGKGLGRFSEVIDVMFRTSIPFYAPPAALTLCLVYAVRELWQGLSCAQGVISTGLSLFGLAVFVVLSNRPDSIHLFPATLMALIVMSWLLYYVLAKSTYLRSLAVLCACLAFFFGSYVMIPGRHCINIMMSSIAAGRSLLPRAGFVWVPRDQEQAVDYVLRKTAAGDRIYVGVPSHDRFVVCDVMFYFLSGHHSATRYHDLIPGVATTDHVQREIVDSIRHYQVPYVILWRRFAEYREPNLSSISSGVTLLDDFLHKHFSPIAIFGEYTVLKGKTNTEK